MTQMTIPNQLSGQDIQTLISIMNFVCSHGPYSYLEIGSYLGGSLQWHLSNSHCKQIVSIDKRSQDKIKDERHIDYAYTVTTQDMLNVLTLNNLPIDKLTAIDGTVDNIPGNLQFDLVFIDAEHTNQAVFYDGQKCLAAAKENSVIMFHDDWIVFRGIDKLAELLTKSNRKFCIFKIVNCDITVIVLGDFVDFFEPKVSNTTTDWSAFIDQAEKKLADHVKHNQGMI